MPLLRRYSLICVSRYAIDAAMLQPRCQRADAPYYAMLSHVATLFAVTCCLPPCRHAATIRCRLIFHVIAAAAVEATPR